MIKNINHILVDEFLDNIKNKKLFTSNIFSEQSQKELINTIESIELFKGNLSGSDISFITKA